MDPRTGRGVATFGAWHVESTRGQYALICTEVIELGGGGRGPKRGTHQDPFVDCAKWDIGEINGTYRHVGKGERVEIGKAKEGDSTASSGPTAHSVIQANNQSIVK
jgi:hypothetical protein